MRDAGLIRPALGFIVWLAAFVALYAMLSVGCRFGWDEVELVGGLTLQRAQLVAILAIHLAAGFALVVWLWPAAAGKQSGKPATFIDRIAWLAAVAALASSAFTFVGVFGLSACV